MFKAGSLWKPPIPNIYTNGMPEELLDSEGALMDPLEDGDLQSQEEKSDRSSRETSQKPAGPPPPGKRALSDKQRDHLEELLRSLVPDRSVGPHWPLSSPHFLPAGTPLPRRWSGALNTPTVGRRLWSVWQSPCQYWRLVEDSGGLPAAPALSNDQ